MYESIGVYCMYFRKFVLKKTLKEICGDTPISNLSAFEHGKANNIKYLFVYFNACTSAVQQEEFLKGVFNVGSQGGI